MESSGYGELTNFLMRKAFLALGVAAVIMTTSGCVGPEQKFARGMSNLTEFTRMGEIRRSMEQTYLFDSADQAYTKGFIHGFNRSVARTFVGLYEVVTFPFPGYDPLYYPEHPVYPSNYKPKILADPTFLPDASLGFGGGDVAPFFPGSRFRIFEP
jgi:putative exosortase-associated protein (TIGR04073 family)